MRNEILARPRKANEELRREHVTLEAIATCTGEHEVAGGVGAAAGKRVNVIEGGEVEFQRSGAVDAPATAVAHRGVLYRALVGTAGDLPDTALGTWFAREGDSVKVPTTGHVTSLKRKHPETVILPSRGVAHISDESVEVETRGARRGHPRGDGTGTRCRTSVAIRAR
jgi:hypothetical protein